MGRMQKESSSMEAVYSKVSSLLAPDYILKDFDIYDVHQHTSYCVIEIYEKEDRIHVSLHAYSDVVLDGYCKPDKLESKIKQLFLRDEIIYQKNTTNRYPLVYPVMTVSSSRVFYRR